jgi:hypothetical protein
MVAAMDGGMLRTTARASACWLAAAVPVFAGEVPERLGPVAGMPSFQQHDPAAELPNGGRMYCAPAAASNPLAMLFARELEREGLDQADLVRRLAAEGSMYTDPRKGTRAPNQFLRGIARFVRDQGVKDFSLRIEGLRDHAREFGPGHRKPRLETIRSRLAAGAAVWLNIGWYGYDPESGIYERDDGHWLTVVGYGADAEGKAEPGVLTVLDSRLPGRFHLGTKLLTEGTVEGASRNFRFPARGVYQIKSGLPLKRGVDCALLDAVVVLRIPGREIPVGEG